MLYGNWVSKIFVKNWAKKRNWANWSKIVSNSWVDVEIVTFLVLNIVFVPLCISACIFKYTSFLILVLHLDFWHFNKRPKAKRARAKFRFPRILASRHVRKWEIAEVERNRRQHEKSCQYVFRCYRSFGEKNSGFENSEEIRKALKTIINSFRNQCESAGLWLVWEKYHHLDFCQMWFWPFAKITDFGVDNKRYR